VVAPTIDARARAVIAEAARARDAPWLETASARAPEPDSGAGDARRPAGGWGEVEALPLGIQGAMAHENAAVAAAALGALARAGIAIPASALSAGFGAARWPGRLEACPTEPRLWWDGAHNPQGVVSLRGAGRFGTVVLALSRDKDVDDMVGQLALLFRPAGLVATRARNGRAMEPETIANAARSIGWPAASEPDLSAAIRAALARSLPREGEPGADRVLLTGSLFAVGEAMEAFGGAPGEWQ
jgi:dihydrofolate synthase/folylpolyglutamate synthase